MDLMTTPTSYADRWITSTARTHWVRIGSVDSSNYVQQSFPFLKYGSKLKAKKIARIFRNKAEKKYNRLSKIPVNYLKKKGTCINRVEKYGSSGALLVYYYASYRNVKEKKTYQKWFACSIHNDAKKLCQKWRNKMKGIYGN